ncbi:hypothetical protein DdX_16987 [Ditylenchus destructor]|uniref:HAT C-terminal dimerisation domain-containing protein n=2 Tax=Ditylenchus destructor TaxID=166010 RepID=A0AAD4QW78_9BILA|nr:hypothetical protein DdX_16987 [Ditylenchus destructor]
MTRKLSGNKPSWMFEYADLEQSSAVHNLSLLKTANEGCEGLQELDELIVMLENEGYFKDYLTVLQPIYEMVKEVQAEREPTASKILLHIANIWLNIKENIAQQNPYINSLSQAMQHAFVKKIGDLSDPDWLKSTHFNVNVAVTAAFLDPIVHSQLAYLCDKIPAFDYEKMKQIIHKAARPFVGQSPRITSTKRTMFPQLQTIEWIYKPIDDELSMYTTMRKYTDDALEFWNETQKILPILSKVAKIFLGIEASSSPSERSFKELRYLVSNFTRNRMHPEFNATLVQLRNSYLQETL